MGSGGKVAAFYFEQFNTMQSDKPDDICHMQRLTILDSYHNSMLPVYHPDQNSKTKYNKHVVAVHAIIIIMLLYLITET